MAETEYVRCRNSFAAFDKGYPLVVTSGTVMATDDERYKGHEVHFEPMAAQDERMAAASAAVVNRVTRTRGPRREQPEPAVEQTTAAPGEVRNVEAPQESDDESNDVPQTSLGMERPADYAPKSAWVNYAREKGWSGDEDDVTKRELIDQFGS